MMRKSLLRMVIVSAMPIALGVLGWLQYRWSNQVTDSVAQRMRTGLTTSAQRVQAAFQEDTSLVCDAFDAGTVASAREMRREVEKRARDWKLSRPNPPLVANVYLVTTDPAGDWLLEMFDPATGAAVAARWPERWTGLRERLSAFTEYLDHAPARQWHYRPWILDGTGPVLFGAVAAETPASDTREPIQFHLMGYVLLELDRSYLATQYFPRAIDRYFRGAGETDYRVEILTMSGRAPVLFDSLSGAGPLGAPLDAQLDLVPPASLGWRTAGVVNIRSSSDSSALRLIAQHRAGSLDLAVARLRQRNLSLIFALLLVLSAGFAFLLLQARRARELARLQLDFVAAVSHELRTPVTAVCSIADNLAEGVVDSAPQIERYGKLLQAQGRRLRAAVEDILLFSAHRDKGPKLEARPTDLAAVVERALTEAGPILTGAGMEVELKLPPSLPHVWGDAAALQTSVRNLVDNAAKYASAGRWIGISAEVARGRRTEVRLTVADRGPGIPREERGHVFDPFFRGAAARSGRAAGTGLGLSIVHRLMEAMGGRVTLASDDGRGCAFTLHLAADGGDAGSAR